MSIIQAVAMGQPELDVMVRTTHAFASDCRSHVESAVIAVFGCGQTIDIPMDEANMPSFVFAVMPRKDAKNLRSNARDLVRATLSSIPPLMSRAPRESAQTLIA